MPERRILKELGAAVTARRRELGMDQAELAKQIGKSASYLSRIEAGRVTPSLEVAAATADALDTDRQDFQRLALAAQIVRLAASHLDLLELRTALHYLSADDSPLAAALDPDA